MVDPKKQKFNTQDIIANLRSADPTLIKVIDFLMSVPFLSHPMLLKILTALIVLAVSLVGLSGLIAGVTGIIQAFATLNIVGFVATIIPLGYTLWLASTTLFNKNSDLKLADLGTWSKVFVIAVFISLIAQCALNIWIDGIINLITKLFLDLMGITTMMYLVPFIARYFDGVVLDSLSPHPNSKMAINPAQ